MKNTVSKGILFYLLVLVGTILGIVCILAAVLVFSPGTQIFGISYFKNNSQIDVTTFNVSEVLTNQSIDTYMTDGRIATVEIKTNYVSIDIANTDSLDYSFHLNTETSGLTKETDSRMTYNCGYNSDTKTLTITVNGPESFLFFNKDSKITFNIPKSKADSLSKHNINIVTESGNVSIANHEKNNITIKNLNANIGNNGYLYVNKLANIAPGGSVTVESVKGTIRTIGTIDCNLFKIKSEGAKIGLANVNGEVSIQTKDSTIELNDVSGKLFYSADAGVLKAKSIGGDFECSELVNISNIFVDHVSGNVLVPKAAASNIEIGTAEKDVKISTTTGKVILNEANSDVQINTESGKIDCTVNSAQKSNVILSTKTGHINAKFKKVNGTADISTQKGNISFIYRTGEIFTLEYTCEKNKPSISKGITTSSYENNGTFAIGYDPNGTCENKITITNNQGRSEFENNL